MSPYNFLNIWNTVLIVAFMSCPFILTPMSFLGQFQLLDFSPHYFPIFHARGLFDQMRDVVNFYFVECWLFFYSFNILKLVAGQRCLNTFDPFWSCLRILLRPELCLV